MLEPLEEAQSSNSEAPVEGTPVVKKRGRKKKEHSIVSNTSSIINDSEEVSIKQGLKRKIEQLASETETINSPSRPSRSRKVSNYLELSKGNYIEDNSSDSEESEIKVQPETKIVANEKSTSSTPSTAKRRGRKKKSEQVALEDISRASEGVVTTINNSNNNSDAIQTNDSDNVIEVPVVKKRGRKKKTDLVNSNSSLVEIENDGTGSKDITAQTNSGCKSPVASEISNISISTKLESVDSDGDASTEPLNNIEATQTCDFDNLIGVSVVKKRGRKKKSDSIVSNSNLPAIKNDDPTNPKTVGCESQGTYKSDILDIPKDLEGANSGDSGSEISNNIKANHTNDSDNLPEVSVPKKRGRKKKVDLGVSINDKSHVALETEGVIDSVDAITSDVKANITNVSDNLPEVSVPKKRGRKKKVDLGVSINDKSHVALETEGVIDSVDAITSDVKANITNVSDNLPEVSVPKKRGRKKKVDLGVTSSNLVAINDKRQVALETEGVIDSVDAITYDVASTTPTIPKKRGRKRKSELPPPNLEILNIPRGTRDRKSINYLELFENNEEGVSKKDKLDPDFNGDSVDSQLNCTAESSNSGQKKSRKWSRRSNEPSATSSLISALIENSKLSSSAPSTENSEVKIKIDEEASTRVMCAVCRKEILKASWPNHKLRYHNNLAWKVGEEPIELDNQAVVMYTLTDLYKRKKPLHCEICGKSIKSVIGYLSHKSICTERGENKEASKIECEHCKKTMLPVSVTMHLKYCRVLNKEKYEQQEYTSANSLIANVSGKRRAATKALNIINSIKCEDGSDSSKSIYKLRKFWTRNFNFEVTPWVQNCINKQIAANTFATCCFDQCDYKSSDAVEIFNHLQTCDKKLEQNCVCKICLKTLQVKEDILKHLSTTHATFLNIEDEDDFDVEASEMNTAENDDDAADDDNEYDQNVNNDANTGRNFRFLTALDAQILQRNPFPNKIFYYPLAKEWALKFCESNYCTENLFSKWRNSKIENLEPNLVMNYLPYYKYSICTAELDCSKYVDIFSCDYTWKRYKLFETSISNNAPTIFCGGPISAMSWVPTPYDRQDCEQILAVAVLPDPDKDYLLNELYSDYGLIQFWNFGTLDFKTEFKPNLEFCIAHEHNPIWCMEWCPSGCYNVNSSVPEANSKRLGLLAVGCGDSEIYIYSVCLPELSGKIFKINPVAKLSMKVRTSLRNLQPQVTKLSWCKAAGHERLAAGYGNGMVAIFNVSASSSLLKAGSEKNGVESIFPYKILNCHNHAVTALSLHHLNNGCRWLMTGSIDRSVKYWDLQNASSSLSNYVKFPVTDGAWLNHWMSSVHCYDNNHFQGGIQTYMSQIRNFKPELNTLLFSNSAVLSISGSEWTNGFIQGNAAGEVTGFFPNNLYCGLETDRMKKKKAMLSCTRLVAKNLSISERVSKATEQKKKVWEKPVQVLSIDIGQLKTRGLNPEPLSFKESEKQYGLVFCNFKLDFMTQFINNSKKYRSFVDYSSPNLYPLQSVRKVAFNPNNSTFNCYASGYQAGFVRIHQLRFLEPLKR